MFYYFNFESAEKEDILSLKEKLKKIVDKNISIAEPDKSFTIVCKVNAFSVRMEVFILEKMIKTSVFDKNDFILNKNKLVSLLSEFDECIDSEDKIILDITDDNIVDIILQFMLIIYKFGINNIYI
ncbi:MAG: hypothetical protein LC122_12455 [Chitinophagales bacterium]|nr:hypothetical protein [Chitinophagales bacterium]